MNKQQKEKEMYEQLGMRVSFDKMHETDRPGLFLLFLAVIFSPIILLVILLLIWIF